jgi:uncharacterized membrane protein
MSTRYHPKAKSILGKTRVEAFSDGVFAVAITLLVLNLQSTTFLKSVAETNLWQDLLALLPKFLVYALSFVIIGIYWVAHHNTFHYIKHSDRTLLWLNIFFLLWIVFIPFPTALLGQYPEQQFSIIMYGSTLVITGIALQLLWWYATSGHRLVDKDIDPHLVIKATQRNLMAPCIYLLAVAISFFGTFTSLVIFSLVPMLYILPGSIDRHWTNVHMSSAREPMETNEDGDQKAAPTEHPVTHATKERVSGRAFYQRQISALETRDTASLLTQYHLDATIAGFDFTVKGHDAIRKHFDAYLTHLGMLKLKNTEKFAEIEDAIFFEATMITNLGEARVYNVFLLRDGKATHHFTGIISLIASN